MPEIKCEQRSPEWYSARLGRVTASRIADIMAKTKTGPSASRKNYAAELVCERLTGQPSEAYTNQAMQRGIERFIPTCVGNTYKSEHKVRN